jgi:hypothetical protein
LSLAPSGADSGDAVGELFTNALSGLTLFQRNITTGYERLSAYRFHNTDPLVMVDGGNLTWQVGSEGHPGATKCGNPVPLGTAIIESLPELKPVGRVLAAVNVTTYAWVYVKQI